MLPFFSVQWSVCSERLAEFTASTHTLRVDGHGSFCGKPPDRLSSTICLKEVLYEIWRLARIRSSPQRDRQGDIKHRCGYRCFPYNFQGQRSDIVSARSSVACRSVLPLCHLRQRRLHLGRLLLHPHMKELHRSERYAYPGWRTGSLRHRLSDQ